MFLLILFSSDFVRVRVVSSAFVRVVSSDVVRVVSSAFVLSFSFFFFSSP